MLQVPGARRRATTLGTLAALLLGTLVAVLVGHPPAGAAEPSAPERRYAPGIDPSLPADATVRGTVLGPDGRLRDYVLVEAFSVLDPGGEPVASDLTYEVDDVASHGAYTLHLPAGDYLVRFSSPDGASPALQPAYYGGGAGTTVTVTSGQDLLLDPVRLQRDQGAPVTGRLVDATGAPLPYASVWLVRVLADGRHSWWDVTSTGEDGTYVFDAVPRGRVFTLSANAGYDDEDESLELPTTWLGGAASHDTAETFTLGTRAIAHHLGDLRVLRGVVVTGRVAPGDSLGDDVDVALLHLDAAGDAAVVAWDWTGEGKDGFRFRALPGRYTIAVRTYGGEWRYLGDTGDLSSARTFTVADTPYDVGTITLAADSSLVTFSVLDRFGEPADGYDLQPYLFDRDGDGPGWVTDLGQGRFRARVLWGTEFTVGVYDLDQDEWRFLGGSSSWRRARFVSATEQTPTMDLGVISFQPPAPTAAAPVLPASARNGQVLTVPAPAWSLPDVGSAYQWLRDGAPLVGATSRSYALGSADVGHRVSVRITGHSRWNAPGVVTSTSVLVRLGAAPVARVAPVISGNHSPGGLVVASRGTWPAGVTTTLQWYADGRPIPGATASSLRLDWRQAGRSLTVVATATRAGYSPGTRTSRPVRVAPARSVIRLSPHGATAVRLRVTGPGTLPATGRVVFHRRGKAVASSVLTLRDRGTVIMDLARLGRGRHRVTASYAGSAFLSAARARPVTIRIR